MEKLKNKNRKLSPIYNPMSNQQYKKLNMSKLKFREHSIMSTEEALKDVTPIDWPEDVLNGDKKVIISKEGIIFQTTSEHRPHG